MRRTTHLWFGWCQSTTTVHSLLHKALVYGSHHSDKDDIEDGSQSELDYDVGSFLKKVGQPWFRVCRSFITRIYMPAQLLGYVCDYYCNTGDPLETRSQSNVKVNECIFLFLIIIILTFCSAYMGSIAINGTLWTSWRPMSNHGQTMTKNRENHAGTIVGES